MIKIMKKSDITFILIAAVIGSFFFFHKVRFIEGGKYDVIAILASDSTKGYGVKYKEVFEIWRFGDGEENSTAGVMIWPLQLRSPNPPKSVPKSTGKKTFREKKESSVNRIIM